MLNVTIQHSEDMAVLRFLGRIVAGDEADILRKALDSVFEIFSSEDAVSSRPVAVASTHDTAF